jgi:hypothetical protein
MNRLRNRGYTQSGLSGTVIGILLMAFVVLAFAAAFYYYSTNYVETDKIGCPVRKDKIPQKWIVILDSTSEFKDNQKKALDNFIEQITSVAPKYSLIKIYELTDNTDKLESLASVCSPGDPANIDKWTESERKVKQRFDQDFKGRIEQVVGNIRNKKGGNSSPIMQSIQSVALLEFGDKSWDGERKLFVISDFVQIDQTLKLDFSKQKPDFDILRSQGAIVPWLSQLKGVKVYPMMIPNDTNQDSSFQKFWLKYFYESNAARGNFCFFGGNCDLSKL